MLGKKASTSVGVFFDHYQLYQWAVLGMNAEFGKNRTISSTNRRQVRRVTRNEPKGIIPLS